MELKEYGFLLCLSILEAGDPIIIQWAVNSDMVEICCTCIAMGNELTKVVRAPFLFPPFPNFTIMVYISECIIFTGWNAHS